MKISLVFIIVILFFSSCDDSGKYLGTFRRVNINIGGNATVPELIIRREAGKFKIRLDGGDMLSEAMAKDGIFLMYDGKRIGNRINGIVEYNPYDTDTCYFDYSPDY